MIQSSELTISSILWPSFGLGVVIGASIFVSACNVETTASNSGGLGGEGGGANGGAADCPQGATVVLSDYLSTQIALTSLSGEVKAESLLSTGSTMTDGLAFVLSGDVVVPNARPLSGRVVLLDRFGTNVISWVDPRSGEVMEQLPIGTGFESNPQDYLEIDENSAWVSRWGQNGAPGKEAFDIGGDVLVLNLENYSISHSLVIPVEDDLPPRPGPLSRVEDDVFLTLDRIAIDFSKTGEAQLIRLDAKDGRILDKYTVKSRKACGRLTPSPDGTLLALACTGALTSDGEVESLEQSALLLFDAKKRPLQLVATYEALDLIGDPLQGSVSFPDEHTVLLKTQTPWGGNTHNRLFSFDLESGKTDVLLEASPDEEGKGKGIVYSDILCAPGCSETCLMSDADTGKLQVIGKKDGRWTVVNSVVVESKIGLPPVDLGAR